MSILTGLASEPVFNAAMATQVVFQQPVRGCLQNIYTVRRRRSMRPPASLQLLDEKPEDAIELFERGLASCENPALKGDMTRVLASLKSDDTAVPTEANSETGTPLFLGAYRETLEAP